MKKRSTLFIALMLSLVMALAFSSLGMAATLSNGSSQSCGEFIGTWHFVNNQTGGAAAGQLIASFNGVPVAAVGPSKVLGSTQHFYVTSSGTLTGAYTLTGNGLAPLPGKLVLSDFSCDVKEPPKK